jgi:hypothetical protein
VAPELLSLTSAGSTSHSARFEAAMFRLITSVHDGGQWRKSIVMSRSRSGMRFRVVDALLVVALAECAARRISGV